MMNKRMYAGACAVTAILGLAALAGCDAGSRSGGFSGPPNGGGTGGGGGGSGGGGGNGQTFQQVDRLARPVVNEVFATVANNRHQINNQIAPTQDPAEIANDIQSFMTGTAGRSQQITDVVKAVLVPDVMKANLNASGQAAYLGVETNGATGGTFGGRKLTDDVVDISLGIVFGNTIPSLGLAPNDNKAIPSLTSDNVGPESKNFQGTFPYLGNPR